MLEFKQYNIVTIAWIVLYITINICEILSLEINNIYLLLIKFFGAIFRLINDIYGNFCR